MISLESSIYDPKVDGLRMGGGPGGSSIDYCRKRPGSDDEFQEARATLIDETMPRSGMLKDLLLRVAELPLTKIEQSTVTTRTDGEVAGTAALMTQGQTKLLSPTALIEEITGTWLGLMTVEVRTIRSTRGGLASLMILVFLTDRQRILTKVATRGACRCVEAAV